MGGNNKRNSPAISGEKTIENKSQAKALRPRWLAALATTKDKMNQQIKMKNVTATPRQVAA